MPISEPLLGPLPLDDSHDAGRFDCGEPALDDYLRRRALGDQRADTSRTRVATRGGLVVAHFSLAAASVEPDDATERLASGQGLQRISVILLARLAVDVTEQGRGLGGAMLVEILARCEIGRAHV